MAKNAKNEVAVITKDQITLDNVPMLLAKVNEEIQKLKGDREKNVRITEDLDIFGKVTNITELNTLRAAYAYVTRKLEAIVSYDKMFEEVLGQKMDEPKLNGYTAKQWQDELLAQAAEITFASKLEKLEATRKILMENVSKEQKFQESMKDILGLLGGK